MEGIKSDDVLQIQRGEDIKTVKMSQEAYYDFLDEFVTVEDRRNTFRGKNLGGYVTDEQYARIADGTFKGFFIGDYWLINDIYWRIADINYWLRTGSEICTTPHLVMVPDTCLYSSVINDDLTASPLAYIESAMRMVYLTQAYTIFISAFGEAHVLSHKNRFVNGFSNNRPSASAWYDSVVELMNEPMVYGQYIFSPMGNGTIISDHYEVDKTQLALFAINPGYICNFTSWWLRDYSIVNRYACVAANGYSDTNRVNNESGVRPVLGLIG